MGREITVKDFPVSKDVSGVNMALDTYGMRELHWHQQAEWAIMLRGSCQVTVLDWDGNLFVSNINKGNLWYFPSGLPHSLQGLEGGCEFLIVFDDGSASEYNTLLLTEWMAHIPKDILGANFSVAKSTFNNIPKEGRWIFQGEKPTGGVSAKNPLFSE